MANATKLSKNEAGVENKRKRTTKMVGLDRDIDGEPKKRTKVNQSSKSNEVDELDEIEAEEERLGIAIKALAVKHRLHCPRDFFVEYDKGLRGSFSRLDLDNDDLCIAIGRGYLARANEETPDFGGPPADILRDAWEEMEKAGTKFVNEAPIFVRWKAAQEAGCSPDDVRIIYLKSTEGYMEERRKRKAEEEEVEQQSARYEARLKAEKAQAKRQRGYAIIREEAERLGFMLKEHDLAVLRKYGTKADLTAEEKEAEHHRRCAVIAQSLKEHGCRLKDHDREVLKKYGSR